MAINTRRLQRQAAALRMKGWRSAAICKELKIRETTLLRWQESPVYLKHLAHITAEMQHNMEVRLMRIISYNIDLNLNHLGAQSSSKESHMAFNALNIFKTIIKERVIPDQPMPDTPETTPKLHKTSRKSAQTSLQIPVIAPTTAPPPP